MAYEKLVREDRREVCRHFGKTESSSQEGVRRGLCCCWGKNPKSKANGNTSLCERNSKREGNAPFYGLWVISCFNSSCLSLVFLQVTVEAWPSTVTSPPGSWLPQSWWLAKSWGLWGTLMFKATAGGLGEQKWLLNLQTFQWPWAYLIEYGDTGSRLSPSLKAFSLCLHLSLSFLPSLCLPLFLSVSLPLSFWPLPFPLLPPFFLFGCCSQYFRCTSTGGSITRREKRSLSMRFGGS